MSEGVENKSLQDAEWGGHLEEAWKQLDVEQRRELVVGLNDYLTKQRDVAQAKAFLRGKAEHHVRRDSLFPFSSRWTGVHWLRDEILTLLQSVLLLWLTPFHLAFGCNVVADWSVEGALILLLVVRWSISRHSVVRFPRPLSLSPLSQD